MNRIAPSILVSALALGASGGSAMAQAASAAPQVGGSEAENRLEEVVVTATRRSENLQNVPIAVTAITEAQIAGSGVVRADELSQLAAGLVVNNSTWATQPVVRGVGTRNSGAGDESNVAIYIDGVYQPSMNSNNFNLLNVEQIEVLKGPQGTLFGRNSTGGAINVITRKPSEEASGQVSLSYGSYDTIRALAYLTGPLGPGLSGDVAGVYETGDGYVRDLLRGGRIGDIERFTGRARLRWQPSDSADFTLAASYSRNDDPNTFLVSVQNGNTVGATVPGNLIATRPRTFGGGVKPTTISKQFDINLQASFDLGAASLESTTDYQENDLSVTVDNDATPAPLLATGSPDFYLDAISQEVRLVSTGSSRFKWIAGVLGYWSTSKLNPFNFYLGSNPGPGVNPAFALNAKQNTMAFAGFGEATWEVVDNLFVTGGIRYSFEEKKFYVRGTNPPRDNVDFDSWTPRVSLRYQYAPNSSVYATYSRGFKSGVFNSNALAAGTPPVKPEYIDNYELGLKAEPTAWLRTNVSVFKYKYTDLQTIAASGALGVSSLQNVGKAKTHGVDLDIEAVPMQGLTLNLSAEYLHARYGDSPGVSVAVPVVANGRPGVPNGTLIGNTSVFRNVAGNHLTRAPKVTVILGATYKFDALAGEVTLAGNVNYNDGFFIDAGNRLRQPAYTMINASAGWADPAGKYQVTLWAKNLADENVVLWGVAVPQGDLFSYQKGRTFGVTAAAKF